jgi:hypothetical protein
MLSLLYGMIIDCDPERGEQAVKVIIIQQLSILL